MTERVRVILEDETVVSKKDRKLGLSEIIRQRFSDAVWSKQQTITVGGAGGIGSNVLYILFKHGHNINLYEFDTVEAHNVGGQMYDIRDIGKSKSNAMSSKKSYINPDIYLTSLGEFKENYRCTPITISCFDNMKARKLLFEAWVNQYSHRPEAVFIDGRKTWHDFCI